MIRYTIIAFFSLFTTLLLTFSFTTKQPNSYQQLYFKNIQQLQQQQQQLLRMIKTSPAETDSIKQAIRQCRLLLKSGDFWFRYFAPLAQKKINGPLPVEWETEVFEKYEKPYRREGAGLTLAYQYLEEPQLEQTVLANLIEESQAGLNTFLADSITQELNNYHHLYLCNRLYLLNLAAIYTTGFECPETTDIIPELLHLLINTQEIYQRFNEAFPATPLTPDYMSLYQSTINFVRSQSPDYTAFDHFAFLKNYVNPLFVMNQRMILQYGVVSKNLIDYSLNKQARSIFDKKLYFAQQPKGVFVRVTDSSTLNTINQIGKLLFYDPILSANNERSCASCHNPQTYFTDTVLTTAPHFNRNSMLPRNTPTLLNAQYNHLIMADGKHLTLQEQTIAVITNPNEMGSNVDDVVKKVMSCKTYRQAFNKLLQHTPQEKQVGIQHIASALTYYYSKFGQHYADFDNAMENRSTLNADAQKGFNLFMSKAQCATCHFVPQFNGVKPPCVGSEFEVLGTPATAQYQSISSDLGRYLINPAPETLHAFRTGTLRNSMHTKPYMHNGVFMHMEEVIDFYDGGGGAGRGLDVPNQTLSGDSLHLNTQEKKYLLAFLNSLNEHILFESAPAVLPPSSISTLNTRKTGGNY